MKNEEFPREGQVYRHYKGGLYLVEAIVRHSEDLSQMVLYRSLSTDGSRWVRPLEMWSEYVEKARSERFVLVDPKSLTLNS